MSRIETLISMSFFLSTIAFGFSLMGMMAYAGNNDEAILTVGDCVTAQWKEHESRTGNMPSRAQENTWHNECKEFFLISS